VDQGKAFGLHGRLSNAAAENLSTDQKWDGDEFIIRVKGTMREAESMVENLTLTRRIETRLGARIVAPIRKSQARDDQARRDRGVEECLSFLEPVQDYQEKVFFHTLAAEPGGQTFVSLLNRDAGGGQPLGLVMRWNQEELSTFTEWEDALQGILRAGAGTGHNHADRPRGAAPEGDAAHAGRPGRRGGHHRFRAHRYSGAVR
jgi:hypothetical protein